MTITRIANNNTAQQVELIANSLEETFRRIVSAKACIIANFPQISTTPIDFFIWIKIPYKNGSYKAGMAKDFKDRQFLNNMVFTIRIIEIKDLVAIHGSNIIKKFSDGGSAELDLYAERHNDQFEISNFIKERIGIKYFHCPEVIWLKGYKKADIETLDIASMIFFDDTIFKMENVINHVAEEIIINNKNFTKGFYSYPEKDDEGNEIYKYNG